MTHVRELLSEQLLANANDKSFYVPFEEAVKDLTESHAVWKPNSESNSILEIVNHLIYWNKTWQKRFKNNSMKAVGDIENDVTMKTEDASSFQEKEDELLEVLLNWQKMMDAQKLDQEIPDFPVKAEWWGLIGNVMSHNAYHIGQVVYIRKQCEPGWQSSIT